MREIVYIDSDYIKLQDLLKFSGAAETGGQAKLAIQYGDVLVNGEVCTMRGKKLRDGDIASFQGEEFEVRQR